MKIRRRTPKAATYRVAVFLRVDLDVEGEPSESLYDTIGETLQTALEVGLDARPGTKPGLELAYSTAKVLGPITDDDGRDLDSVSPKAPYRPLIEHLGDTE